MGAEIFEKKKIIVFMGCWNVNSHNVEVIQPLCESVIFLAQWVLKTDAGAPKGAVTLVIGDH